MAGVDTTNIGPWLEKNYHPSKLANIAFKDAPLCNWLPYSQEGGGEELVLRWQYGNPQAQGTTVAQAQAGAAVTTRGGQKAAKASMDFYKWYAVATFDNPTLLRAAGGNSAATDLIQRTIREEMEALGDTLETFMFSDGYPSMGAIGNISGSTFTVAQEDIEHWEVGMEIVLTAARVTGDPLNSGASLIVSKVDRDPSSLLITCTTGIVATIAAAANGNFAFQKTSRITGAVLAVPYGIGAFVPDTVSTSDAFGAGSLNRSVDATRLAGWRQTIAAGTSVQQGMVEFFTQARKYGVKGDALWCSYERYGRLIQELGNNVRYVNFENKDYGLKTEGISLFAHGGEVPVLPSSKCKDNRTYLLKRDSWKVFGVQQPFITPTLKYTKAIESATADEIEMRWRAFYQLGCLSPKDNAVALWS